MPFGAGWKGAILASTGAAELAISIKSLQEFQAEKKSTPYTVASAGTFLANESSAVQVCPYKRFHAHEHVASE